MNESIISKDEEIKIKNEEVKKLSQDRDKLSLELENKEKERKQIEEEKFKQIKAREKAEKVGSLYKRRDNLRDLIRDIQ